MRAVEAPKNLEITQKQRTPGLEDPLTPEQVEGVRQEASRSFMGAYSPQAEQIQEIASKSLPQGLAMSDLLEMIIDDF